MDNKRKYSLIGIAAFVLIAIVGAGLYRAEALTSPQVSAVCKDGKITFKMEPSRFHQNWAIRVDNKKNPWNPDKANDGDYFVNGLNKNTLEVKATPGNSYNWWVHSVTSLGLWSASNGGPIICPLESPTDTQAFYVWPDVVLSWEPVEGAVKYAVRVNNVENPFTPDNLQKGDFVTEVTEAEFTFPAEYGKEYTWWVHAIDKNGVWSEMSDWATIKTL